MGPFRYKGLYSYNACGHDKQKIVHFPMLQGAAACYSGASFPLFRHIDVLIHRLSGCPTHLNHTQTRLERLQQSLQASFQAVQGLSTVGGSSTRYKRPFLA